MNKKTLWWLGSLTAIIIIVLFSIEQSRTFLLALILRLFFFAKKNIISLLAAFFLVKGKFILTIFLKKVALLSVTGLSKRYVIERVINYNLKIHFFDHIATDIKHLIIYIKENFKDFPLVKQMIAGIAFLGSLSFVGKFMGGMLAMKVFVAKFWSFILALVLKVSTGVLYFFTDYLWGSWLAPLVEILIFSWLLDFLEKIPFLKKYLFKIYDFFMLLFGWFEVYLEKVFHLPVRRILKFLVKRIKKRIYTFIGYERVSAHKRLEALRLLTPNKYQLLKQKRELKKEEKKEKSYFSTRQKLLKQRGK